MGLRGKGEMKGQKTVAETPTTDLVVEESAPNDEKATTAHGIISNTATIFAIPVMSDGRLV